MITQAELQYLLLYNPDTGIFTRRVDRSKRWKAGEIAGHENNRGYWLIKINRIRYRAHRLSWLYMTGSFPDGGLDHINGIKTDNRFINLRLATDSQNQYNSKLSRKKIIRIKGVSKNGNGYLARATIDRKYHYLGFYKTAKEAGKAYQKFVKEHHGEFYRPTL